MIEVIRTANSGLVLVERHLSLGKIHMKKCAIINKYGSMLHIWHETISARKHALGLRVGL